MKEGVLIVDTLYVYFHFYSPYMCVRGWGVDLWIRDIISEPLQGDLLVS